MSDRRVYFGTRERMEWIKSPKSGLVRSVYRSKTAGEYTNGGGFVLASDGAHENYSASWALSSPDEIDLLENYFMGIYGTGPLYFLDPMVCQRNALPKMWSDPMLGSSYAGTGMPTLIKGKHPVLVDTPANSFGFPAKTAVYTLGTADVSRTVWIPIPEGYFASVGVVGSATGNGAVQYATDAAPSTWVDLPFISVADNIAVNTLVYSAGGGITLRVKGTSGTLSLTAMTVKVLGGGVGSGAQRFENLLTNPSFESTSGTVEVYRNLLTNPSFETTSGTVEVYRNLASNPRGATAGGWGGYSAGATTTLTNTTHNAFTTAGLPFNSCMKYEFTTAANVGGGGIYINGQASAPVPIVVSVGTTYYASAYVTSNVDVTIVPTLEWKDGTGTLSTTAGTPIAITAGVAQRVEVVATAPAGALNLVTTFYRQGSSTSRWQAGDQLFATGGMVVAVPSPVPYFDGAYSPDPDLTPSWTGTANASASALYGVPVSQTSNNSATVVRSYRSQGRKSGFSLRTTPMSNNNDSNVFVAGTGALTSMTGNGVTFEAGKTYTAQGWVKGTHTSGATNNPKRIQFISNTVTGWTGAQWAISSTVKTDGEWRLERITFTVPTTAVGAALRVTNGGAQGMGDVWWDDFVLIEGTYTGEYFDGSTSPDPDLTPSWTSTANASASVLSGVGVASVAGGNGRALYAAESQGGRRLCIQRTGPNWDSAAGAMLKNFVTADVGKTFTVIGKCTIPEGYSQAEDISPASASDRISRGIYMLNQIASGGFVQVPNEVGTHEVRMTFTVGSTANTLRLAGGGLVGQKVFWDDVVIVEGDYRGEYFDGSMSNIPTAIYSWLGNPHASQSVVQYIPERATQDRHIMGKGNSGLAITNNTFDREAYSAAIGRGLESVSLNFKEVGAWQN